MRWSSNNGETEPGELLARMYNAQTSHDRRSRASVQFMKGWFIRWRCNHNLLDGVVPTFARGKKKLEEEKKKKFLMALNTVDLPLSCVQRTYPD